jgi:hypothetical protein
MIRNKINGLRKSIGILELSTPHGGRCRVFHIDNTHIHYIQGKTSVYAYDLAVFYGTFARFRGIGCSTEDLKKYNPDVYTTNDKGGHDCNCVLFMLLIQYFFGNDIKGTGSKGNSYRIFY